MAEQPKIIDYFSSQKRNVKSKRKASFNISPPYKRAKVTLRSEQSRAQKSAVKTVLTHDQIKHSNATKSKPSTANCGLDNLGISKCPVISNSWSRLDGEISNSILEKHFETQSPKMSAVQIEPAHEKFKHLVTTTHSKPDVSFSALDNQKISRSNKALPLSPSKLQSASGVSHPSVKSPPNELSHSIIKKRYEPPSPKKLPIKPVCSIQTKSVPAHERFQHLIQTKPEPNVSISAGLTLPFHLKTLLDLFKAADTVISMLYNRKELCLFEKITESVEKVVRRTFNEKTLNQIRAVYEDAYSLRYEKLSQPYGPKSSSQYKLIVDPKLRNDGTDLALSSPTKGHLVFSGNRLIQRRTTFQKLLIQIVSKFHQDFLVSKLGHSITDLPPVDKIQRWHPKFPLESVPPVTPADPVARPEGADSPRITRASEAVALFREKGMKREALCALKTALANPEPAVDSETSKPNPPVTSTSNASLKGVSMSLLEKIRAKEARIRNERMMRGEGDQTRRAMISRLPEMVALIWSIFSTAKRSAVTWAMISQKVSQSHRSGLLKSSVDEHLKILLQLVPDWIEKVEYAEPHLRVVDMKRPIKAVQDSIISKLED